MSMNIVFGRRSSIVDHRLDAGGPEEQSLVLR
jgi:hypothetical protein